MLPDAVCSTWGDFTLAKKLYEKLKDNYFAWNNFRADNGLYYQFDVNDGMELMISGHGFRPTINSYQYGDANALAKIAAMVGKAEDVHFFRQEAAHIKAAVDGHLWDEDAQFYKNISDTKHSNDMSVPIDKHKFHEFLNSNNFRRVDVREQIGYVPWYFDLPDEDKSVAWKFLTDENHFAAPFGPTTAERCHPEFMAPHSHECLWNGPSWPFATSQTLTALGNLLANYKQDIMTKHDYFALLRQYANCHFIEENGKRTPFIDGDQDPFTGVWLAREKLLDRDDPHTPRDRGIYYNHSTFCDPVPTGLAGLRTRDDNVLEIDPLFSEEDLDYFCADGIPYHSHSITVAWDKDGSRYNLGQGLHVLCDGTKLATFPSLTKQLFAL